MCYRGCFAYSWGFYPKTVKNGVRDFSCGSNAVSRTDRKTKRKKSFKTLSVSKLSYANLQRNKRRTAVTILALGCSGILFLVVANIANNITAENYARMLMPKGDFEISLNYAEDDREYPENNLNIIQLQNPLNDDLKTQIMSLDGVESIDEKHTVLAEAENVVLKHSELRLEESAKTICYP